MAMSWVGRWIRHAGCGVLLVLWLAAVTAAGHATGGVANADGGAPNLAYIVSQAADGGRLVIIDLGTGQVAARLNIGGDPRGVMLSVDSRLAYISQAAKDAVTVVDARTRRVVDTVPAGDGPGALALDVAVTGYLYVADADGNSVTALDLAKRRAVATIPVGRRPLGFAVAGPASGIADAGDAEVYVANAEGNSVSVISARRQLVVAEIAVPGGPQEVVVPAAGGVAYVGTRAGVILALDMAGHRVLGQLLRLKGGAPGAMDYDAVTGRIYVPDPAAGVVEVLRPAAPAAEGTTPRLPAEPARTLAFPGGPAAVAITFDGALGFVAERDVGKVAMFDTGTYSTLTTYTVGDAPRVIITGAYPPRPITQPGATQSPTGREIVWWPAGAALVGGGLAYLGWSMRRRRQGQRAG